MTALTGSKPGQRFLRLGSTFHAGDTLRRQDPGYGNDPRINLRMLSMRARILRATLHVPAMDLMRVFGKTGTFAP